MKIYLYDPISFEFLKEEDAPIDPLESKNKGSDVFLMPRCSSTNKPKLDYKYGFALVYDAAKDDWGYVEDHRGKTLWKKETGEKTVINELYINMEDYSEEEPPKVEAPLDNASILLQIEKLRKIVETNLASAPQSTNAANDVASSETKVNNDGSNGGQSQSSQTQKEVSNGKS